MRCACSAYGFSYILTVFSSEGPTERRSRSCASPQSASCSENYVIRPEVSGRTLRLIDLASYAMTVIAFGSALFSVRHYEERLRTTFERLDIFSNTVDTMFDAQISLMKTCEDISHSPFRLTKVKRAECDKLSEYLRQMSKDPQARAPLILPVFSYFSVPEVRALANEVFAKARAINKKIADYRAKAEVSGIDYREMLFFVLAIPVLAFAFGLGRSRRSIDLYLDWQTK
jgi:hypothetical protein